MKKNLSIFICALLFSLSLSFTGFSAASINIESSEEIKLKSEQKTGYFDINLSVSEKIAGAEFAVITHSPVKISEIETNAQNANIVSPVFANGAYHFSFYSAENIFSGNINVKVKFTIDNGENTSLRLHQAKIFSKNAAAVNTETSMLNQTIKILFEGQTNPIIPPSPPPKETTSSKSSSDFISSETTKNSSENSHRPNDTKTSSSNVTSSENESKISGVISTIDRSKNSSDSEADKTSASPKQFSIFIPLLSSLLILSLAANGIMAVKLKKKK